ncbi:hypothetical protein GCWU000341_01121 [Oribacterium sp. oral taxon 078 str. F0262]|nr:hypothetical protein GCWU000341_01121 [Oribacterium sp. oral taxon 078 str. F0262]
MQKSPLSPARGAQRTEAGERGDFYRAAARQRGEASKTRSGAGALAALGITLPRGAKKLPGSEAERRRREAELVHLRL